MGSCQPCNTEKGAHKFEEFRYKMWIQKGKWPKCIKMEQKINEPPHFQCLNPVKGHRYDEAVHGVQKYLEIDSLGKRYLLDRFDDFDPLSNYCIDHIELLCKYGDFTGFRELGEFFLILPYNHG